MKKYLNKEGHSGVTGYEIDPAGILVEFNHDAVYLYTYESAGREAIKMMKTLAEDGRGLSTYISRNVKDNYKEKVK
jgi:hypothetical protein